MTGLQKRAIYDLIISAVVLPGLTIIFFSGGGAAAYVHDVTRKILLAVLLGLGYIALLLVLFLVRVKPKDQTVLMDERDERIARQALGTAFVILAIYVVLTCIILYEVYRNRILMPVGWMWFLAYSSSFIAIGSRALLILVFYARTNGHGQG